MVLYRKFKDAKFCCKSLNRSGFSNVQVKSKEFFEKLELLQNQVLKSHSRALF